MANPSAECLVAAMNDRGRHYDYPDEVRFECADDRLDAFRQLADFLNVANVDVVSLQHEYGIFGGEAGGHVIELLRNLQPPVHTTPHKARLGLSGSRVILTFGLLSPNKGIEHVIRAMPAIVSRHPEARYLVVGATHPHLLGVDGDP